MNLIRQIEEAGSDHLPTFGGNFEGGYCIQQNPAEFADFIRIINSRKVATYLQIGSAAGGSERFLCEQASIPDLTIIDDGNHAKFHVWNQVNKPALKAKGVAVSEFIGSSHTLKAEQFLKALGKNFDLIGIDGDHTPNGVELDWKLVAHFTKPGTWIWFHDISGNLLPPTLHGPKQTWEVVRKAHKIVFETYQHCGIGVIEIIH